MKKGFLIAIILLVTIFSTSCGKTVEEKLIGAWTTETEETAKPDHVGKVTYYQTYLGNKLIFSDGNVIKAQYGRKDSYYTISHTYDVEDGVFYLHSVGFFGSISTTGYSFSMSNDGKSITFKHVIGTPNPYIEMDYYPITYRKQK